MRLMSEGEQLESAEKGAGQRWKCDTTTASAPRSGLLRNVILVELSGLQSSEFSNWCCLGIQNDKSVKFVSIYMKVVGRYVALTSARCEACECAEGGDKRPQSAPIDSNIDTTH